ncbi:amino acid adenylation, partial [Pseudomonas syringae pv. japonica str. M301072]
GPTEAAIDVTHWTCSTDDILSVPIGRVVGARVAYILDADLALVPQGASGELYIGG